MRQPVLLLRRTQRRTPGRRGRVRRSLDLALDRRLVRQQRGHTPTDRLTHYVLDTSRNGLGAWTAPPGKYTDDEHWCNAPGRGVGDRPTTDTGAPLADAYLYVKTIGESDGTCHRGTAGPGDPEYGGVEDPPMRRLVAGLRPHPRPQRQPTNDVQLPSLTGLFGPHQRTVRHRPSEPPPARPYPGRAGGALRAGCGRGPGFLPFGNSPSCTADGAPVVVPASDHYRP